MSKNRIKWIDFARSIAVIMVILCHAVEAPFFYAGENIAELSLAEQCFGFTAFTIGRLGVPVFLFISGYLLLQRSYDDAKCWLFWKKNLLQLLVVTEVWILLFNICSAVLGQQEFTIMTLVKNMLFMKEVKMPHAWYLPMIVSMYVTVPFVAMVLDRIELKTLYAVMILTIIYFFLLPSANVVLKVFEKSLLSNRTFLYFSGGLYGIYLLIGYLFKRGVLDKFYNYKTGVAAVVFFLITVWFQYNTYQVGKGYKVWYDFVLLLPIAMFVFMILKNVGVNVWGQCIWRRLAVDSFGIYLIHKPIQNVLLEYLPWDGCSIVSKALLSFVVTFLLSWSFVYMVAKVSSVGRWLFLIKEPR